MNFIEERFDTAHQPIEFVQVATVDNVTQAHRLTRAFADKGISWQIRRIVGHGPTEAWQVNADTERMLEASYLLVRFMGEGRRLVCVDCGHNLDGYHGLCPGCENALAAAS